jgi:uncharacterized membrane protein
MQSEIFFFIASIGFVIVGVIGIILIVYCIRMVRSLLKITEKIESSLDDIGDVTMDLIDDLRNNPFFRMIFRTRRTPHTQSRKERINEALDN